MRENGDRDGGVVRAPAVEPLPGRDYARSDTGSVRSVSERARRFIIPSRVAGIVADDCPPDEVFALLDDEYARSLLSATSHEPMTAPELSDQCDMSVSTVYRRLNALEDCGLVTAEHVPDLDGNHKRRYEAHLDTLVVSLDDGDFDVSLRTATRTQEFADAFTDLWEGL